VATTPSDVPGRSRLSIEDRVALLDTEVARQLGFGGRVKSRSPTNVVVAYGYGNLALHSTFAFLTVFVNGFFAFPWIVWANTMRERRVTLEVDPYGDIRRSGPTATARR
jgi:hypothetical protein